MFKSRNIKILAFLLILFFFGSYITYQIQLPAAEDLPRLIKNGEMILSGEFDVLTKNVYSYTEPNQPFANHHWFSAVVFYLLHEGVGYTGIVVFKILIFLSIFSLLFFTAIKKTNFWLVACLSIPTVIILIGRSAARPEMFSYLFIVLFLYILFRAEEDPESNKIYWLIPLQLLWVNMHLFFGIGVLLVGGFLFEKMVRNFRNIFNDKLISKLAITLALMCLTLFATPYGIKGALYSLNVNTSGEFPIFSSETQSISSLHNSSPVMDNIPIALFPFLAALLLVSFLIRLREKPFSFKHFPIFYFLASVSTILLGFKVIRSLPMFGLIFLPAICENLNPSFIRLRNYIHRKSPEIKRIFKIAFLTLFLGLIIYLTLFARGIIAPYTKIGLGLAPGSLDASNFMKENKIKGPIFNDTDIGSYLIGQLYPDEKVFVDNRFGDAYSADFFANVYIPMSKDEDSWVHLSEKYKINTVVFYQYDGGSGARDFLYRRIYDPLWAWVYADRGIVILVKNTEENREIVEKFQITKDNIRDRLSHLESSSNMDDVLGVADLYSLVGLSDFATEVYLRIVSEYPNRGKIWMILGGIELKKVDQQSSNPALALIYLQNAINAGWKTPESYSYLALAHYRIGNTDKAKEAVDKQLKIDPNNQDGKKWLEVFAEDELKK